MTSVRSTIYKTRH